MSSNNTGKRGTNQENAGSSLSAFMFGGRPYPVYMDNATTLSRFNCGSAGYPSVVPPGSNRGDFAKNQNVTSAEGSNCGNPQSLVPPCTNDGEVGQNATSCGSNSGAGAGNPQSVLPSPSRPNIAGRSSLPQEQRMPMQSQSKANMQVHGQGNAGDFAQNGTSPCSSNNGTGTGNPQFLVPSASRPNITGSSQPQQQKPMHAQPKAYMQVPGQGGSGEYVPVSIPCQIAPAGAPVPQMAPLEAVSLKFTVPSGTGASGNPATFQIDPSVYMGAAARRG